MSTLNKDLIAKITNAYIDRGAVVIWPKDPSAERADLNALCKAGILYVRVTFTNGRNHEDIWSGAVQNAPSDERLMELARYDSPGIHMEEIDSSDEWMLTEAFRIAIDSVKAKTSSLSIVLQVDGLDRIAGKADEVAAALRALEAKP